MKLSAGDEVYAHAMNEVSHKVEDLYKKQILDVEATG